MPVICACCFVAGDLTLRKKSFFSLAASPGRPYCQRVCLYDTTPESKTVIHCVLLLLFNELRCQDEECSSCSHLCVTHAGWGGCCSAEEFLRTKFYLSSSWQQQLFWCFFDVSAKQTRLLKSFLKNPLETQVKTRISFTEYWVTTWEQ